MKITKRLKKVIVTLTETKTVYPSYECPACKTKFIGGNINENITRFKCSCGQELIINKFIKL